MSRRMIAVTVGILFFVQMATAMTWHLLIQAFLDGNPERAPLTVGVLLMMCSGSCGRRYRPPDVSGPEDRQPESSLMVSDT